jgi:hypothetical protein
MAVAFDAKPTLVSGNSFDVTFTAATSADLASMTVGSGANRALIAGLFFDAAVSVVAVHWDSAGTNQAMTQIGTATAGSGSTLCNVYLFGLVAPTSGNKNLHVTWTGTADGYATAISWTGVDQAAAATSFINFNSSTNSANPSTITITTTSGNATVEYGGNHGVNDGTATTQTLWSEDHNGTPNQWASYALSVSGSTAYSETVTAGTSNVECGCDIVAVQAAATATGVLIAHG